MLTVTKQRYRFQFKSNSNSLELVVSGKNNISAIALELYIIYSLAVALACWPVALAGLCTVHTAVHAACGLMVITGLYCYSYWDSEIT